MTRLREGPHEVFEDETRRPPRRTAAVSRGERDAVYGRAKTLISVTLLNPFTVFMWPR
jgi:hypothetical protein